MTMLHVTKLAYPELIHIKLAYFGHNSMITK